MVRSVDLWGRFHHTPGVTLPIPDDDEQRNASTVKSRNLAGGLGVAVLLAAPFAVPTIAGISTWKYLLGVIGLWVFVRAGMGR